MKFQCLKFSSHCSIYGPTNDFFFYLSYFFKVSPKRYVASFKYISGGKTVNLHRMVKSLSNKRQTFE